MKINNRIDLTPGIATNRQPVTPEQMLIICTDLRRVRKLAYENTGVSNKAGALEYFDSWINSHEKAAKREIAIRNHKNES